VLISAIRGQHCLPDLRRQAFAAAKESRQRGARFTTSAASHHFSSIDGTEANSSRIPMTGADEIDAARKRKSRL
jgi:hypothetical protein